MAPSLTLELTFEYFMDERRYAVFRSIALKVMIKSYWFIFVGRVDSETAEGHRVCNYQYLDSPFMCLYSKIKSKVWHFLTWAWWKSYNKNIEKYPDPHPSFVQYYFYPQKIKWSIQSDILLSKPDKSYKNIQKYTYGPSLYYFFSDKVYSLTFSYPNLFCGCRYPWFFVVADIPPSCWYPWWRSWPQEWDCGLLLLSQLHTLQQARKEASNEPSQHFFGRNTLFLLKH